jgi:hypothetical protein
MFKCTNKEPPFRSILLPVAGVVSPYTPGKYVTCQNDESVTLRPYRVQVMTLGPELTLTHLLQYTGNSVLVA